MILIIFTICSAMRLMISWWVNFFSIVTFRTNVQMSIIPLLMSVFVCSRLMQVLIKNQMGFLYMNLHSCSSNQIFSSPWFYFLSKFKIHTHTHTHTHTHRGTHTPTHTHSSLFTSCPSLFQSIPLQSIFSWKSKLKYTAVHITCFFSRCKIFTNKT